MNGPDKLIKRFPVSNNLGFDTPRAMNFPLFYYHFLDEMGVAGRGQSSGYQF